MCPIVRPFRLSSKVPPHWVSAHPFIKRIALFNPTTEAGKKGHCLRLHSSVWGSAAHCRVRCVSLRARPARGLSKGNSELHAPLLFLGSLVAQLVKNPPECGRPGFHPWVGKIPWRSDRLPTPVFWPGEFMDCIVSGVAKSQTRLSDSNFYFLSSLFYTT